jgi:hypothetical protein
MIEELFDILKTEKLDTDERVERAVMHDRPARELTDVVCRLSAAVGDASGLPRMELSAFDFLPNAQIGGHHGWCGEWGCRLGRAERLARFAALWADRVLIPSYFADYERGFAAGSEEDFRYWLAGDLKVVLALKPVLESGIVQLFSPSFSFCEECARAFGGQVAATRKALAAAKEHLEQLYWDKVEVWFGSWPNLAHGDRYVALIDGPEDVVPCGGLGFVTPHLPPWLPERVKRQAVRDAIWYRVPRSRLKATGMLSHGLDLVASDVLTQHVLALRRGTKYLTNRAADAAFLRALNDRDDYASWTEVLGDYLQYEMPIIEAVPLDDLVALRRTEHDAFLVYRDTLRHVIQDRIAGGTVPTDREAAEMYEDLIQPSLNKMRAKVTSIRRSLAKKTGRNVLITAGLVAVGVFSGLLPADVVPLVTAVGGFNIARDVLDSLASAGSASSELRSENLYFLWKIGERSARRRAGRVS